MIRFVLLNPGAIVPTRATDGSAGFDLYADIGAIIQPHSRQIVTTGIMVDVGAVSVGLVCPRSGLAYNYGLTVLNAPGIIDSDYRGEVKVILYNTGTDPYTVRVGERIAQLVVVPCIVHAQAVASLEDTARGGGGFGSTGA